VTFCTIILITPFVFSFVSSIFDYLFVSFSLSSFLILFIIFISSDSYYSLSFLFYMFIFPIMFFSCFVKSDFSLLKLNFYRINFFIIMLIFFGFHFGTF